MILKKKVGIISYGAYIPKIALPLNEIEKMQHKIIDSVVNSLGVMQKTVPDCDEDSATLAVEATQQAINRLDTTKQCIDALFVGSESHPYAVKPTGTIVKQALGLSDHIQIVDLEFACKAGTAGIQIAATYCMSNLANQCLAVGTDCAQASPGDALEYTASSGAAAFIIGKNNLLAKILATNSFATDTPDFWRKPGQSFPEHAGRFTGTPSYFHHVIESTKKLLEETNINVNKIDYCIFHSPNAKFPKIVAKKLGFSQKQLEPALIVKKIGNCYAATVPLSLSKILDIAKTGEKILVTSYGSGAGADSFLFEVLPLLEIKRKKWNKFVEDQIDSLSMISYQEYRNLLKKGS